VNEDRNTDTAVTTVSRRRALAALAGVGAVGTGGVYAASELTRSGTAFSASFTRSDATSPLGVDYAGNPVMGSPDAPLRLYYWSDYQCPYCAEFDANTLPRLATEYVESGDLAVVFLEFPLFGRDSETAARLSKCVWRTVRERDPDAWGEWHHYVFRQQGPKNSGWASKSRLYDHTAAVDGVSVDETRRCLRQQRDEVVASVTEDVDAAMDELSLRRVTPMFALSDTASGQWLAIPGAQPYETFERAIQEVRGR
jgi:protein-disulfide isomerase